MPGFVPVVPATPSLRAEALGQRRAGTIEPFRQQNPDLSGLEVRQATRLALARAGGESAVAPALLALSAGPFSVGLVLVLATDRGSAGGEKWPLLAVLVGFGLLLAVVLALKRR